MGSDPVRPATAQSGPTEHPNPQIVPPQGSETGINPSQKPDHAAPTAPKEAAPASAADRELRQDIQNAIAHEPTLGNARVQVGVAAGTITLDGTVRTGKDRQAATRIAKSFAGDREVVDHITILGQAPPAQ
jgi:osmotically-inducible protein OsmY